MGKERRRKRNWGKCQAPYHVEGCPHPKPGRLTKDHFTPKCIAKMWGWSRKQLNDEMNIQYLSPACHQEKDRPTPEMREQLEKQMGGMFIGFGEHAK